MSKELYATVEIPGVSPAQLWPLLTEAGQLTQWFCEHAAVNLPAGSYSFWGRSTPDTPAEGAAQTRLGEWSAPDSAGQGGKFSFTWHLRGQDTQVEYSIASTTAGCELTVHHTSLSERLTSKAAVHDFWYTVLENLRLLAVTGRPQTLPEYGPKPGSSLMLQLEIAAPAADIFRYLIDPEWMSKLWNDEKIVVEPHPGGVYDYGWKEGGPRQIVALEAPRLLSFTWLYPPETEETVVTWRLEDLAAGRTRLSLTHSGFPTDYDDEEYRAGWFSFLAIIKGLCELGERRTRVHMRGSEHGEA